MFAIALETSTPHCTVALGRDDTLIDTLALPAKRRHNLELVPTLDALLSKHDLKPSDLSECYLSLGPGSFTGLRIAVATAKMLALTLNLKLVGIPTLDVLQHQHPTSLICLNVKRDTAWSAGPNHKPALRSLDELRATGLPLIADTLDDATPPSPDAATVFHLGRAAAQTNQYADPQSLAPLYIREPEAVTLWNQRHGPT